MLTKQESDQKELAAKQEQNQAAINEIATNKAELETTEAGLTTQTSRTRSSTSYFGCRIGYSSR